MGLCLPSVLLSFFHTSSALVMLDRLVGLDMWINQMYPYYHEFKALPNLNHCDILSVPAIMRSDVFVTFSYISAFWITHPCTSIQWIEYVCENPYIKSKVTKHYISFENHTTSSYSLSRGCPLGRLRTSQLNRIGVLLRKQISIRVQTRSWGTCTTFSCQYQHLLRNIHHNVKLWQKHEW